MAKKFAQITLKTFTNRGFNLTPLELKDVVPFAVQRLYYFDNLSSEQRTGEHCHFVEEEFFIQARGSTTAIIDRGKGKEEIRLGPGEAVYVPNYVWHGFKDASADAVIIALSSTNYNPERVDYLEDYDEYIKIRDEKLSQ